MRIMRSRKQLSKALASVNSHLIGSGLHVSTSVPKFLEDDRFVSSSQHACANVFESIPGGAPVIPWASGELTGLIHDFADEKIWISQEGIVTTAARFSSPRFLRAPSPMNVFTAFANSKGLNLAMSPRAILVSRSSRRSEGCVRLISSPAPRTAVLP